MQNLHNRKKILSEVVSLEAWQQPTEVASHLSLHADVVFKEGRIGGENTSKVRFRLRVRRAELIIIIPENEPVSVVRSSVSRDAIKIEGSKKHRVIRDYSASIGGSASASITNVGPKASVETNVSAACKTSGEETIEHQQSLASILVEQSVTPEGSYRWELSSALNYALSGRPWEAVENPRLTLVDTRKDSSKGIPPVVNVRIKCLREDLFISDIALKDGRWANLMGVASKNKHLAAEAYIRTMLANEGLESGDLSDPFCSLDLAYITVDQSGI